jgi:serine phosphatase RsbU (regulator of sigma subunit)
MAAAIAEAIAHGAPLLVEPPPAAEERSLPPGIVLPLSIATSTFGALVVIEPARDFRRDDELEFAREIARRMARAMENARLYRERDYIARTLQKSLLPPALPDVPGLEIRSLFLPAVRGYEVGGDFYDVFEMPNGRWAAVIGDVCGKGVEAAAITGLARHTLRAAFDVDRPSGALETLNGALLRENLDGRFCTVAYVMIEPDPRGGARLLIASGGHVLPHLVCPDGPPASVGRHGTLLGVVEHPRLEDVEVRLEPGAALVLFTDGILRKDQAFGDEPGGLIQVLAKTPPVSASEVCERIAAYARDLIAENQEDDIAALVLRAL